MMCSRCSRGHSGLCGIPPGRRVYRGRRAQALGAAPQPSAGPHGRILEQLLRAALAERRRLTPGLAVADGAGLDWYDRLDTYIHQLREQMIAVRTK